MTGRAFWDAFGCGCLYGNLLFAPGAVAVLAWSGHPWLARECFGVFGLSLAAFLAAPVRR